MIDLPICTRGSGIHWMLYLNHISQRTCSIIQTTYSTCIQYYIHLLVLYIMTLCVSYQPFFIYTVKPPIMDTPIRGQPPYNGQTACPLPLTVHTFLPPMKGQLPNNGQNARPQRVGGSTVYTLYYNSVHGV